jgi:uncharacterized repeat protein (TIGR03803 family)
MWLEASMELKSFRTSAAFIFATVTLLAAAASAQTYTDLYNFNGTYGSYPQGALAQGRDSTLYGTTSSGGANGYGVVFELTQGGTLKVLYNFDGAHGANPYGGLTLATDGNLYGTTEFGGANGYGTIFKVTPHGSLTTLYSFTGGADIGYPYAPPIEGLDGNFYGTTGLRTGPAAYKITPSGTFTLLALLPAGPTSSIFGLPPLIQGADGNFYGTTWSGGGPSADGTVFKMTPNGTVTTVYSFDWFHGAWPLAPVIQGADGNFYGTTWDGGSNDTGVVFKVTPQGAITDLYTFGPWDSGDGAWGTGLIQATDGNLYGVTNAGGTAGEGVIFQFTTDGSYSILFNFNGVYGLYPMSSPMQNTNGTIYGVTPEGGTSGQGVAFSFDMGLRPFVRLETPTAKVRKTIGILGQGFIGATSVAFNGTPAAYTVISDTFIGATVPVGATSGFVTVTTPGGPLKSNQQFRVRP